MPYPKTRQEYKDAIMHDIYKLVQALEVDDEKGIWIGQTIYHNTREFFSDTRWKPTPVSDTLRRLIPLSETLTFRFQNFMPESESERNRAIVWMTGRVVEIHARYSPEDGAHFDLIPSGKRTPRRYSYRVAQDTALTIWTGKLTPEEAARKSPLFDHATLPRPKIQMQEEVAPAPARAS